MRRWIVCLAGTGVNLALGTLYAWSLYVPSLVEKWGWTRAQLTWPFTVSIAVFALAMVAAGRWQDKVGPRIVCITGGLLMGLGFILSSFVTSVTALIFTFGVIAGAGLACSYVTPVAATIKWFPDKKGLTVGITVSGFGFGAFVFGFVIEYAIRTFGIMPAFRWLGFLWIVVVCGLGALLRNPPPGYKVEGWTPPPPKPGAAIAARDWPWQEMLKTSTFWLLWLAYVGNAGVGLMVISLIKPYAISMGFPLALGVYLVGALSILNGFGRIIAGWLSDAMGRTRAMILIFAITTVNVALMPWTAATVVGAFIALMICGGAYGANFALFPAATAEYFGTKAIGLNYAWLFTAWGVAGVVGPQIKAAMLAARTAGLTGEALRLAQISAYKTSFLIGAGLGVLAVVTAYLATPPKVAPEHARELAN